MEHSRRAGTQGVPLFGGETFFVQPLLPFFIAVDNSIFDCIYALIKPFYNYFLRLNIALSFVPELRWQPGTFSPSHGAPTLNRYRYVLVRIHVEYVEAVLK